MMSSRGQYDAYMTEGFTANYSTASKPISAFESRKHSTSKNENENQTTFLIGGTPSETFLVHSKANYSSTSNLFKKGQYAQENIVPSYFKDTVSSYASKSPLKYTQVI